MADPKQEAIQNENVADEAARGVAIDQDRDTFLPRPSDDPNDPLNWPMYLKASITIFLRKREGAYIHHR